MLESTVKTIGMLGSIAIAVNSLAGPAVLQLPFQFQQSGLIPTILCLLGTAILSAYCCLHTANTVSMMPNNFNFDQCIEFSEPYRHFWNEKAYTVTQLLFLVTSVCLNVAAIIDTAEGMIFSCISAHVHVSVLTKVMLVSRSGRFCTWFACIHVRFFFG